MSAETDLCSFRPHRGRRSQRTVPSGPARWIGASAARSRTAATPAGSTVDASVTTAAASSTVAPAVAAAATAYCRAVSDSDGRFTLAPAYVRPSPSRTAAPSEAPVRARAARASVTSFWSSAVNSGIGGLSLLVVGGLGVGGFDPPHENGIDPVPPAGGPLGGQ